MVRELNKSIKVNVRRSLYTFLDPYSEVAERYRLLRNNMSFAAEGRSLKSIVVTSPAAGEGKSTAAVNLAVSMTYRGDKVLLIDANIRKPLLHKVFHMKMSTGLTNVLDKQLSYDDAILETDVSGLYLLPSGPMLHHAAELLDSKSMDELLEYYAKTFDAIIIDCPQVLGVSETNAIAGKCDGVLMLVKSGKTKEAKALEAKRSLDFAGAKVLGVVLNK